MRLHRNPVTLLVLGTTLAALLGACGVAPTTALKTTGTATAIAEAVPSPSAFVTIRATVIQILPEDTKGLPHQNFVVKDSTGMTLTVNNDTKYGSRVAGLQLGESLVIRGVEYHDKGGDGIHWTHKNVKPGDAGYIQTPDGHLYQ